MGKKKVFVFATPFNLNQVEEVAQLIARLAEREPPNEGVCRDCDELLKSCYNCPAQALEKVSLGKECRWYKNLVRN